VTRERGFAGAALEERLHADLRILGPEDLDEALLLELEPIDERQVKALVDGALRECMRGNRTASELGSALDGSIVKDFGRHDLVGETDA
jgi:hypothetical protein